LRKFFTPVVDNDEGQQRRSLHCEDGLHQALEQRLKRDRRQPHSPNLRGGMALHSDGSREIRLLRRSRTLRWVPVAQSASSCSRRSGLLVIVRWDFDSLNARCMSWHATKVV
jgi:hypothetical protein